MDAANMIHHNIEQEPALILDPTNPANNYLESFTNAGCQEKLVFFLVDDRDDCGEPVREDSRIVRWSSMTLQYALMKPWSAVSLHLGDEVKAQCEQLLGCQAVEIDGPV